MRLRGGSTRSVRRIEDRTRGVHSGASGGFRVPPALSPRIAVVSDAASRRLEILTYAGFYDVPRWFVVERAGVRYVFDCPFSDELDEYPSEYVVRRVPDDWELSIDPESLAKVAPALGPAAVREVHFDETRRRSIDAAVLERFV